MLIRENALAQLNLLKNADNVQVRAAAETVLWLDQQLAAGDLCPDQFCKLVKQHRDQFANPTCSLSAVCENALTNIINNSGKMAV